MTIAVLLLGLTGTQKSKNKPNFGIAEIIPQASTDFA
jgi:hypothetical protein